MKSDFRANNSLAADIERIESSLNKNKAELSALLSNIKEKSTLILKSQSSKESILTKGIEIKDLLYSYSTSIRDVIDALENDMISIDGIDAFDIKAFSPDEVINQLRTLRDNTRNFDTNVENQIKLIIKSKGNGLFADEIDSGELAISKAIQKTDLVTKKLISSLENILTDVDQIKKHSKYLARSKIL